MSFLEDKTQKLSDFLNLLIDRIDLNGFLIKNDFNNLNEKYAIYFNLIIKSRNLGMQNRFVLNKIFSLIRDIDIKFINYQKIFNIIIMRYFIVIFITGIIRIYILYSNDTIQNKNLDMTFLLISVMILTIVMILMRIFFKFIFQDIYDSLFDWCEGVLFLKTSKKNRYFKLINKNTSKQMKSGIYLEKNLRNILIMQLKQQIFDLDLKKMKLDEIYPPIEFISMTSMISLTLALPLYQMV